MEKERLEYLYNQYMRQMATPAEMEEWFNALRDSKINPLLNPMMDADYYSIPGNEILALDGNRSQEIYEYIVAQHIIEKSNAFKLWSRIVTVAAVAAIVLMSIVLFNYYRKNTAEALVLATAHISPGRQGASLTLANGKQIKLNSVVNGELAKEPGANIRKASDGRLVYEVVSGVISSQNSGKPSFNTLSTGNGETYMLVLPDQSKIWLNAASSITYPASFKGTTKRSVQLTGEAYFEISKDKAHPFVVSTEKQQVEVLGTHFNINSYHDNDYTKTTLLEGSVKVSTLQGGISLKPNQQSLLRNNVLYVREVETADAISWKNGYFMFNNENLEGIMKTLSRWYNTTIVYEDETLKNELVFAKLNRYENIFKILKVMERTGKVKFRVEGNTIIISRQ